MDILTPPIAKAKKKNAVKSGLKAEKHGKYEKSNNKLPEIFTIAMKSHSETGFEHGLIYCA